MKKGNSIFICFAGIDGSGKTTQATMLVEKMKEYNIDAEYTWCKFESSLLRLLILIKNKLFVREQDWKKNYERTLKIKNKLFKKRLISALYEQFVLITYHFQIARKIVRPLKRGNNLVCDRYVYDTIVDLALDLGYSDKKTILKINELLSTVPKPDLVFLMDLPEEIAFSRKDDVPSMAFLYEKRKIYKKIGTEFDMVILDGTKAPSELRREIEKEVTKLLTINEVLT